MNLHCLAAQVASALTARHIGGAVNYMAVSETLDITPSTFGAGLAADDLILTLYFVAIYYLARCVRACACMGPKRVVGGGPALGAAIGGDGLGRGKLVLGPDPGVR